jgi:hypothetical protein
MWDNFTNEIEEVHEFKLLRADLNNLPTNDFARHVEYKNLVFPFKIGSGEGDGATVHGDKEDIVGADC